VSTTPTPASIQRLRLGDLSQVRVTGLLTRDADLATTTGNPPGALLILAFAPPHGLAYHARMHLGTDVADRMQAEAALPYLRTGALVSVAGDALEIPLDLINPIHPKPQPEPAHAH